MPLATTQAEFANVQYEAKKYTKFIEKIHHIYQKLNNILHKPNTKYKQHHDQHQVPHEFQVADKI